MDDKNGRNKMDEMHRDIRDISVNVAKMASDLTYAMAELREQKDTTKEHHARISSLEHDRSKTKGAIAASGLFGGVISWIAHKIMNT